MKTYHTFLAFLICLAARPVHAQCMADAGPDKIICLYVYGNVLNTTIGGNPSATGGKPPYTYKWETRYSYTIGNKIYTKTASDFLDDTTSANPKPLRGEKELTFTVTVTDADGTVCKDSAVINFSKEMVKPMDYTVKILEGDTVKLCLGTNVGSNYPIASYLWRPNAGLIDSTQFCVIASPKVSTPYYLIITDSAGCVYTGSTMYYVIVSPVGINEQDQTIHVSVFPNPTQDVVNVSFSGGTAETLLIEFFDEQGKLILGTKTKEKALQLNSQLFSKGVVLYKVSSNQQVIGQGKLIIQ